LDENESNERGINLQDISSVDTQDNNENQSGKILTGEQD